MRLISEAWELLCYGLCPRDHRFIGFRMPRYSHLCNGACPIGCWKSEIYELIWYICIYQPLSADLLVAFSGAHKVVVMQFCWLRCTVALCDVRSLIESALHHPRKMQGGVYVLYHGYQRQLPAGWWKLAYSAASNSSIRTIPSEWWSVWYFSCIAYCSFCLA